MVSSNIVLIAALLIPLAVLVAVRCNAALVFMSLCVGYVLLTFVANDTNSLINFLAPDKASLSASSLRLIMLFLPVVLTIIITLFSVSGRVRVVINVLPAAGVSLLGVLLAVPLLPPNIYSLMISQPLWQQLAQAQAMVVGASALISLLFLWAQRKSGHKPEHGKHH